MNVRVTCAAFLAAADEIPGMVLLYCTFLALKRQDQRTVPHEDLLDVFELEGQEGSQEKLEFGGQIRDGDMRHALRLYRDRASGVVRIEASALRGPKADVPIWTSFVTRYAIDPDHVQREDGRKVSFAALRPPPYVFISGYRPPRNRRGDYFLDFTTSEGQCYLKGERSCTFADDFDRRRLFCGDLGRSR